MVAAVTIFSGVDTLAKWFGHAGFQPSQILFFRYLVGLIPAVGFVLVQGTRILATRKLALHALRAVLMVFSLGLFFWGLARVPLAEGIAVGFTAPLFITALSGPVLGEKVGPRRWLAVVAGFVGALIILRPGSEAFRPENGAILCAAVVFSFAIMVTRQLTRTESNETVFFYTNSVALLCVTPFAFVQWVEPQMHHLGMFVGLGLAGSLAHFLIIIAYRNAPASTIAPLEYLALIWGAVWGWLIWAEQPAWQVWAGSTVIIASGLFIAWREAQVQPDRTS